MAAKEQQTKQQQPKKRKPKPGTARATFWAARQAREKATPQ